MRQYFIRDLHAESKQTYYRNVDIEIEFFLTKWHFYCLLTVYENEVLLRCWQDYINCREKQKLLKTKITDSSLGLHDKMTDTDGTWTNTQEQKNIKKTQ